MALCPSPLLQNYSSSTGYFDDDYTSDSTYTTDDSSNYTTDDGRSWKAHGSLYLTLTQGTYSVTDIKEINPLDIGNLLGNIGGFWGELIARRKPSPARTAWLRHVGGL